MSKIDRLIDLTEKKIDLLKETRESITYESCLYDVQACPGRLSYFMLFEIATGKEVRAGDAGDIRTWLERRKIVNEVVYNYTLIEHKPRTIIESSLRIGGRPIKRIEFL